MPFADPATRDFLAHDPDARRAIHRGTVYRRLAENPPPRMDDHVVASCLFASRTTTLPRAVEEISYHATSGVKDPPKGSLVGPCSAIRAGMDPFDPGGRVDRPGPSPGSNRP